jgi:hypothetical protein
MGWDLYASIFYHIEVEGKTRKEVQKLLSKTDIGIEDVSLDDFYTGETLEEVHSMFEELALDQRIGKDEKVKLRGSDEKVITQNSPVKYVGIKIRTSSYKEAKVSKIFPFR